MFFEDWNKRWHKCIISGGDYFEVKVSVNIHNSKVYHYGGYHTKNYL